MSKIHVIGIGYRPLPKKAVEMMGASGIVLVSERLFEVFNRYDECDLLRTKVKIVNGGLETIEHIKNIIRENSMEHITVLADGDPMFFGIGKLIREEFGRDIFEIYPDLSSMQVAFARIKEPWGEALLISLHGGPDPQRRRKLTYEMEDLPRLLQKHRTIGVLTDRTNNPFELAGVLVSSPVARRLSLKISVCERLGYPEERITVGSPTEITRHSFAHPNVVVIRRTDGNDRV